MDVKTVLNAVARTAARLCDANDAIIWQVEGNQLRLVAKHGSVRMTRAPNQLMPISRGWPSGRAVVDRRTIHIRDLAVAVRRGYMEVADGQRAVGLRTVLTTPLLLKGNPVGVIAIRRTKVRPFTIRQIALLKTFANQAVIAIENVRLFQELQARTRELSRSVEELKALGEVSRAVSSTLDLETLLRTIVARATQLAGADAAVMSEYDQRSEEFQPRASHKFEQEIVDAFQRAPLRKGEGAVGRLADTHEPIQIPDIAPQGAYQSGLRGVLTRFGYRALLAIPLLREDQLIGGLVICRKAPGKFAADVVDLLTTFAAHSALAIQNARLYAETTRRELEATKLYEITSQLASNLEADRVLDLITAQTIGLLGCDASGLYMYEEARAGLTFHRGIHLDPELTRDLVLTPGEGVAGRAFQERRPFWTRDRLADPALQYTPTADNLIQSKAPRAYMAVPILSRGEVYGVLVDYFFEPHDFTPKEIQLLSTLADHAAIAIENVRLLQEIRAKSQQLEAASHHKSEFLANMSHELRTPLNAILGFNEMILGQVYGEVPPDLKEPLTDIQNSGKHLLRLINNVLDVAKIEAGRMELALADYLVQDIVESVRASLRSLAADKGLEFVASVPADIPLACGDAGRIIQCLMNFAGNALKFTRQGRVEISVELQGDLLVYRVADTGIGIPKDKIETVFSEFRQGDATIASEFGGTGLGLSITKKFVEMHRGRIWVESELGKGSTFAFAIPLRLDGGKTA